MIDLSKEMCKQGLKLDFTAHGIVERVPLRIGTQLRGIVKQWLRV
jgi:hypothetical protein